jgi:hypothetical protein
MSQSQKAKRSRGRKDHWLPQGYLRGFIAPSRAQEDKPLWCFHRHSQRWESLSTTEVAFGKGFYDYSSGTDYSVVAHPDSVFARLEREFPQRREQMAADDFATWEQHKDFLLEFMQMMRARSPLAMQQQEAEVRQLRGSVITSVGADRRSVTVDSLEPRPLPEHLVRNMTISRVLQDAQSGIAWMGRMDWCLRHAQDENEPFCTTDQALIVIGTAPDQPMSTELLAHPETVVIFPLCWRACIFGSPLKFDKPYDRAHPTQLASLRADQKRLAHRFVISPVTF